ncbi:MAG TPA: GNAT family N-acetyltransferase [Streptosporangiaceae bacterium]
MHIERFDPVAEPDKLRACYKMYIAGLPVDDPDGPPLSERHFAAWFTDGWIGQPRETALATDSGGAWVGGYLLDLPSRRNAHIGYLYVFVDPAMRRRGHGTALLQHGAMRARANSRTLLSQEVWRDSPGSAFAAAMGAHAGVVEIRRVLELDGIPAGRLGELRGRAQPAAQGYSLLSWVGSTPEEDVLGVATVIAALADAPRNPSEEAHQVDPQRVRDYERRSVEIGMQRYSVAARCDRTGELAGLTQLGVTSEDPGWGFQFITAVARQHRGHRLGLLVKVAMLELLATAEPDLRRIFTGNADGNQHMIAINAELGYHVLDEQQSWELDVSAVPAQTPAGARTGDVT